MGLKIFLSYGHDCNEPLVDLVEADLRAAGHNPWRDRSRIKEGDAWRRRILDGLQDSDCVLAFLSKHSVREPGVCLDELAIALHVKGGATATLLVEPETEVRAPVSVGHIQWLDMADWASNHAAGAAAWDLWYAPKRAAILALLADPARHRFAGEITELEHRLRPVTQAADIPPLIEGFVGREWLVRQLEEWRLRHQDQRLFWLTGGPGAGKSAFSAWITHYQRSNVIGLNLCRWNDEDRSEPRQVLRTLAFLIATRVPDYRARLLHRLHQLDPGDDTRPDLKTPNLDAKSPTALFHFLLAEPLFSLIDGGRRDDRFLLVIDGLDETLRDGRSELVELLAEAAPRLRDWMAVLLTSRPEAPVWRQLGHLPPHPIVAMGMENQDDARVYARGWLGTLGRPPDATAALVERVVGASRGNFLYLRQQGQKCG
jgi:TIR domain